MILTNIENDILYVTALSYRKNHTLFPFTISLIYVVTLTLIVGYYCVIPEKNYLEMFSAFRALKLSRDEEKEEAESHIHMYLSGTQKEY